jgi:DNA polymerase I-like protein with 3'-5' exonuclease and polymerase domains
VNTLYLDVETDGTPDNGELLLVGWAVNDQPAVVQPGNFDPRYVQTDFQALLASSRVTKVSHTLYDADWFTRRGFEVAGPWEDTRVMAWAVNENTPLDLDWLSTNYLAAVMDKRLKQRNNRAWFRADDGTEYALDEAHQWPTEVWLQFKDYCRRDVESLRDLHLELRRGLENTETLHYWEEEEVPWTSVIIDMQKNGLPIDLEACEVLAAKLRVLRAESEAKLRRLARLPDDFNLNSPDQLAQYLFTRVFKLPARLPMNMDPLPSDRDFEVTKIARLYIHGGWIVRGRGLAPTPPTKRRVDGEDREGKHPSTSTPDLLYKHPNDPWVRELCLVWRRLDKLLGTYLEKFPKIAVETSAPHAESEHPLTAAPSMGSSAVPGAGPLVSSGVVGAHGDEATDGDESVSGSVTTDTPPTPSAPTTRIFGSFNQGGTVTGRLSSSGPNLQNIPVRHEYGTMVRDLFRGRFVIGDYDALEMRIMAHFSKDRELLRIFRENLDPHARTAYALFGVEVDHDDPRRGIGKTVNYGVGYGAGAKKLAQVLSLEGYATDIATAKGYLEEVRGFYPQFFRWADRQKYHAKTYGGVNTLAGRRRHLKGQFLEVSSWKKLMYGERQAVNSIIQGSAADIIRRGMVLVRLEFPELRTLAQIHDEAIWEYDVMPTSEDLSRIQYIMEVGHGLDLIVPLIFEPMVCDTWAQKGSGSTALELLEEEARKT